MALNSYKSLRFERDGRIGVEEGFVLESFFFLKKGANVEEPELSVFNEGKAEGYVNCLKGVHGSQLCRIIGLCHICDTESLPRRLPKAHFEPAKGYESFETGSLPFCKGTHVHFVNKASRILAMEGAEITK